MNYRSILFSGCLILSLSVTSCSKDAGKDKDNVKTEDFKYFQETFSDSKILRYKIDGFDQLTPAQKELAYYLYEAGLCGRDIIWDQNYKYNLTIRKTVEAILNSVKDEKGADWDNFVVYAKKLFFHKGIHHHYSQKKFIPECKSDYFASLIKKADAKTLPLANKSVEDFIKFITPIVFDEKIAAKRVNLDPKVDIVVNSATNFYEGVTQKEVDAYYAGIIKKDEKNPISYGLNSKLMKENGKIIEKPWKVGGMYTQAIEKMVFWLEKAVNVSENDQQKKTLTLLTEYYKTGDLKKFDEYSIEWVKDTSSVVDVVNGFIEVYGDPIAKRGSYESVVSIKDFEASKRIIAISKEAQWFEDNSPLMPEHKKKNVTGISAKVITVVGESGDAAPSTPIGINLPNADWIRSGFGSKSVNLGNIVEAYDKSSAGSGMLDEFAFSKEEIERAKKYGALAGKLHTDMHEVIGHASGQINKGVGSTDQTLKNYASCLEEARADLVALYYVMDKKLVDIGVMPDLEVGKAEYDSYIRNGLMTQLVRLQPGEELEEAHMRNRQLNAAWAFEKGAKDKVIEKVTKDGKTFFKINDYIKLKEIFGQLLKEIQRIKSEGDFKAGKDLVENYGVKVDAKLHTEVLERYKKLNIAPYSGFIQPKLVPVMEGDKVKDVKVEYNESFMDQMLNYGKNYGYLPPVN